MWTGVKFRRLVKGKLFPKLFLFLRVYSTNLLETLWEKEKLLITSNFYFSLIVFHLFEELSAILVKFENVVCKLFQFGGVKNLSFGKELTLTMEAIVMSSHM